MNPLDLVALDRGVRAAWELFWTWREALVPGAPEVPDAPTLPRQVSSLGTVGVLREIQGDPLADRLAEHVAALTALRVTIEDIARLHRARVERSHVSPMQPGAVSIDDLVLALLRPEGDRRARLAEVEDAGAATRDAAKLLAERWREAARRLALPDALALEVAGATPAAVEALAESVLGVTDAPFADWRGRPLWEIVDAAVNRDAGEGWPARIGARFVVEVVGRGPLLAGLSLGRMRWPEAIGAASFARALGRAGARIAQVDRPRGLPFVMGRDPFDMVEARRQALFAGLVVEPAFHRRKLGLGPDRARDQAKSMARSAAIWTRLVAMRALVWSALLQGADGARWEEIASRSVGRALGRGLFGVLPRAGPGSALALVGIARAAEDRARLREAYDEDWFDNPKAHEALRHEHAVPAPAGAVATDVGALSGWVAEALD